MLAEAELIAKRAILRWLVHQHPEWTHQDLADALKMSRPWVSKWLRRLRQADPTDVLALHSRSRARLTPPFSIASQPAVVQRILEIRMAPPANLQRIPGPEAILYFLHPRDAQRVEPSAELALQAHSMLLLVSSSGIGNTSTLWKEEGNEDTLKPVC